MKVVILAGGMQSTLSSEREGIPKPMIEIGGKPLLWHILKHFSQYGLNEFIICGGYRIDLLKEYFMDYYIYESDITVDLQSNRIQVHKMRTEDWKVTVVDTGIFSTTGQRVSMIQKYVEEEDFIVAYGDCLSDIDICDMWNVHKQKGRIATIALAKPVERSHLLSIDDDGNAQYESGDRKWYTSWVNADCMIFRKDVFGYLQGNYDLEKRLLMRLSEKRQLAAYQHLGFWAAVETKRDLAAAESLWNAGAAPWIKSTECVQREYG